MGVSYTAIYSFGDSLSDAGDAYLATNSSYAALLGSGPEPVSPPYYQQNYSGTTADVFSNGPVWVQDLAAAAGLGTVAPANIGTDAVTLLSLLTQQVGSAAANLAVAQLESEQHTSGSDPYLTLVNGAPGGTDFAIGGSVTGPTGQNTGATNLTDLAAQFASFKNQIGTPAAGALYTVWSGSNDLLALLGQPTLTPAEQAADVQQSVANELAMVQQLVANGAESVLVLDVPDLGKIPAVTSQNSAAIDAAASALAQSFNTQLTNALTTANFGTAHITFQDTYGLIDAAVANPASYGLTNATDPVYTGAFDKDNGNIVSTDPATQNQYLFFDEMHPTATGHAAVASQAETLLGLACFLRGTRILTPHGEAAVETLRPGDLVVTMTGHGAVLKPIIWVGRSPFDAGRHPRPQQVLPVRIRAGALGEGLPHRDLLVSPGHSLLVDGLLMQADRLVNGATILRETSLTRGEYFHIELAAHDLVVSEGVASESYLDTGNRGQFAGEAGPAALHPDFSAKDWRDTCLPLVQDGELLVAARARLLQRALACGHSIADEPGLVVAPGLRGHSARRLAPTEIGDGVWRFEVPGGCRGLRLLSRVWVPAELEPASTDRRALGVCVSRIVLDGGREVALDSLASADGWHELEHEPGRSIRWTGGDAVIREAARTVAVTLCGARRYWAPVSDANLQQRRA